MEVCFGVINMDNNCYRVVGFCDIIFDNLIENIC